jgi:RHS repeat-associated protein
LYTNAWSPYNYVGLTGKSYDPKASLMDYAARWYSPNNQRFTTRDTWAGDITLPQTLNRYTYVLNNPVFCFLRGKHKNMESSNKSA